MHLSGSHSEKRNSVSEIVTSAPAPRKPSWLKVKIPMGENYKKVKTLVDTYQLHTICQSGNCPNMGECWGEGTATFMILGNVCTRSCSFCAVATGRPTGLDIAEPKRVAEAVKLMGVKHAVITSVNRDELPDKGAQIWYETVTAVKELSPATTIETLIPDVKGDWAALELMISAGQEVVSHNMETVRRLYRKVRPQAKYDRSLEELQRIKAYGKRSKSGIMLGLGETEDEVYEAMDDLLEVGLDVLTLGQYLQPTKMHLEVDRYVHPDEFKRYEEIGLQRGFRFVESGPLVRSSYHAEKHVL
jgi:lipoyl synthase